MNRMSIRMCLETRLMYVDQWKFYICINVEAKWVLIEDECEFNGTNDIKTHN